MCKVLSSILSPTKRGKVERETERIEMEVLGLEMIVGRGGRETERGGRERERAKSTNPGGSYHLY